MDPAALGTTIIGLDRIRGDDARYEADGLSDDSPVVRGRMHSRSHLARQRLAHVLRRTADHVAPTPAPGGLSRAG